MPPAPTYDVCLAALGKMTELLDAVVEDAAGAAADRVRFATEAAAAHRDTRDAVARLDGRLTEVSTGVTSARVETATAVGAAQAAVAALQEEVRFTRRLVYVIVSVGVVLLVGVVAALMIAVLTLKGLDGGKIVNDAAHIAHPAADHGTTPAGASDAP